MDIKIAVLKRLKVLSGFSGQSLKTLGRLQSKLDHSLRVGLKEDDQDFSVKVNLRVKKNGVSMLLPESISEAQSEHIYSIVSPSIVGGIDKTREITLDPRLWLTALLSNNEVDHRTVMALLDEVWP
ncbi:MAG: hypothetical protein JKY09_04975 [Crocinitomicaceae bacterium]|nr:hypothetical protein [Crocinitomicaceae bacterium]